MKNFITFLTFFMLVSVGFASEKTDAHASISQEEHHNSDLKKESTEDIFQRMDIRSMSFRTGRG